MCGIFMERDHIRERLASAASMPKDVVLGASVITILGRNEVCIENYRGIIEYTDTLIR
ncbi:MAG TPA: sporulation protein, partial [Candidatus Mediterraneibacter stercoravium]|nr:sporulation protein [Candidatus Mediterraneibacter stercoravium]